MAVAKDSGAQDLILRPLSAKLLPPTKPEREGWVNRSLLLDIQGRSRQRQLDLAQTLGINDYPMPAGGCLLTDISVTRRLQKIFQYWKDDIDRPFLELAKVGRHFWTGSDLIVVARNEQESYSLRALMKVWTTKWNLPMYQALLPLCGQGKAHRRSLGAFSPSYCTLQQSQDFAFG